MKWYKGTENPKEDGIYVTRLIKPRLVSALEFVSAAGGWNTSYKPDMFEWLDESESPSGANVLVEAIKDIARQKTTSEHDEDEGDLEEGYNAIIEVARKALAQYNAVEPEKGNPVFELADKMEKMGVRVSFGLNEDHIKVIEKWIAKFDGNMISEYAWIEIGKEIGWHPLTAMCWYLKDNPSLIQSPSQSGETPIDREPEGIDGMGNDPL